MKEAKQLKKVKIILITAVTLIFILAVAVVVFVSWHNAKMTALSEELISAQEQEQKLEGIIAEIKGDNTALNDKNKSLLEEVDELKTKIQDLLTEDEIVFDAGAVMEEIQNISELATIEYRYTNVGTLDASKKFSFVDWKVPFSDKTAIVTMDGIIKAGIDLSQVQIACSEAQKIITVSMPASTILSNELKEDSFMVYEEKDSAWNPITLDDSNELRKQIKEKAEQNAIDNQILTQADERAAQLIQSIIESSPNVKGNYKITWKTLT